MPLSVREADVVASVWFRATELSKHPDEKFVIEAAMVPTYLGAILMLAERAEGRDFPPDADPAEYLRRRIGKFEDEQATALALARG